ncbi:flavin reductase family protein [bacterium]|nr:flavin reductase family protein [bacterium]
MELDPAGLEPPLRYKILIGCIVPRPIAFVSTVSADGVANLAPYSFFNGVGSDPMTVLFCPANGADGGEKDSLRNAKPVAEGGTGEFVVNAATEEYAEKVALAAEPLPFGESEFDLTGLTPVPSSAVAAPRVKESPFAFECRTTRVIRTNPGAAAGGNLVLGEVVRIHVRDGLLDERFRTDPDALRAVGRMGGFSYCRTRDRFDLKPGIRGR